MVCNPSGCFEIRPLPFYVLLLHSPSVSSPVARFSGGQLPWLPFSCSRTLTESNCVVSILLRSLAPFISADTNALNPFFLRAFPWLDAFTVSDSPPLPFHSLTDDSPFFAIAGLSLVLCAPFLSPLSVLLPASFPFVSQLARMLRARKIIAFSKSFLPFYSPWFEKDSRSGLVKIEFDFF